jgi:hypothetical protein
VVEFVRPLLLFVKSPTIIVLTMIWWVGVLRQMLIGGHALSQGGPLG